MLRTAALLLVSLFAGAFGPSVSAQPLARTNLVEAILSDNAERQLELIRGLVDAEEVFVKQALEAWRGGLVYLYETNDLKIPVLLDPQTDAEGRAAGIKII